MEQNTKENTATHIEPMTLAVTRSREVGRSRKEGHLLLDFCIEDLMKDLEVNPTGEVQGCAGCSACSTQEAY